ncbi:MAG: hypothetical protein PHU78_02220 [Heliobacteriaceae bacterium]|nr:hypothetical protein [Heliobacteriaceae bacterium]
MKDAKKQQIDVERELVPGKQRVVKTISHKNGKAAFAVALAQGIIPQTLGEELFEELSRIGNYSFLQAVERKVNRDRIFNQYVESEIFSQEKINTLLEGLAGDFTQEVNTVETLPDIPELQGDQLLPDSLTMESTNLSLLMPVSFDQGVFETTGGAR